MPPTTRRGSRVDRTLDLGNDVMANILCSFASAQDVLNSRCVCTAWRDLIAMPGILLGCTACNHRTVYVDASHLRAFFWVKVLGTNCTSLTFQASEEACRRVQSEALMLPGLAPHLPFPALDLPLLTECLVRCPNLTSLSIKCCSLEPNIAWEDLLRALMVSPRLGHMLTSLKLSHESFGSLTKGHLRKIARAMPNLASVDVPFDFGHSIPLVWWAPFKNMRKLEAWRQTVLANELHQVLKACRQLEVIDMCASNIADFKEGWWRSDAPPQTVVKLRLTEMELPLEATSALVHAFPALTELELWGSSPHGCQFGTLFAGMPALQTLKLGAHDSWLDGTQFERIRATQPQLTALSLTNSEDLVTDRTLRTISNHLAPTLKSIDLVYSLERVTTAALAAMVADCEDLRFLKLLEDGIRVDKTPWLRRFAPGDTHYDAVCSRLHERGGWLVNAQEHVVVKDSEVSSDDGSEDEYSEVSSDDGLEDDNE